MGWILLQQWQLDIDQSYTELGYNAQMTYHLIKCSITILEGQEKCGLLQAMLVLEIIYTGQTNVLTSCEEGYESVNRSEIGLSRLEAGLQGKRGGGANKHLTPSTALVGNIA